MMLSAYMSFLLEDLKAKQQIILNKITRLSLYKTGDLKKVSSNYKVVIN